MELGLIDTGSCKILHQPTCRTTFICDWYLVTCAMYLYLYIHFDTISRTTLNSTLCLAQTGTSTEVALVMREREQCESSKLGRSLSCDKKRNFTTLCWNFACVTYHHIAELLPFKPAKIITQLHQFWQKRQDEETTQCNNHHNMEHDTITQYPPTPIFP